MGWRSRAAAAAVLASLLGCDTKPAGPAPGAGGGGQSAPSKELNAASHSGTNNPAPLVDPTGSVQVYKGVKHDIQCLANLQGIGMALVNYNLEKGEYPPPGAFFRSLLESGKIQDVNACAIPRSNPSRDEVVSQTGEKAYRVTMDRLNDATPPDKPIAWDPIAFQDGRHYLTFGGRVDIVAEDQFEAFLAKWEGKK